MAFSLRFSEFCFSRLPYTVESWNKMLFLCFLRCWIHFCSPIWSKMFRKSSIDKFNASTSRLVFSSIPRFTKNIKLFSDSSKLCKPNPRKICFGKLKENSRQCNVLAWMHCFLIQESFVNSTENVMYNFGKLWFKHKDHKINSIIRIQNNAHV